MGKDYTPLRQNGASQEQIKAVYEKLKKKEVVEGSTLDYFEKKLPSSFLIDDIEIGYGGTRESIVSFKDNTFVVFLGVIDINKILRRH